MGDIRPQPRELDSDAELGLTVLAPGIALFALIAVVAQFAASPHGCLASRRICYDTSARLAVVVKR